MAIFVLSFCMCRLHNVAAYVKGGLMDFCRALQVMLLVCACLHHIKTEGGLHQHICVLLLNIAHVLVLMNCHARRVTMMAVMAVGAFARCRNGIYCNFDLFRAHSKTVLRTLLRYMSGMEYN